MRVKPIQLFILVLTISASLANGQEVQKLLPRPNDFAQYEFTGISCSDERNCTIAATRTDTVARTIKHLFERTTDGGSTWHQQSAPYPTYTHSLYRYWQGVLAIDSLHIVAYGDSGLIARTTDAGTTWLDASVPEYRNIYGGSFYDRQHGVLVGGGGLTLVTSDGGITWRHVDKLPFEYLRSCRMLGPNEFSIFQYGHGPIYSTVNGGNSFDSTGYVTDPASNTPDTIRRITQIMWQNRDTLLAFGAARVKRTWQDPPYSWFPLAMRSVDGGVSWNTVFFADAHSEYFEAMSIHSSGIGLAGGGKHRGLLSTSDGGRSWRSDTLSAPEIWLPILSDVTVINPNVALANFTRPPLGDVGFLYRINLATLSVRTPRDKVRLGTHISPNPSSGNITIQKWYTYDGDVRVIDVIGRTVLTTKIDREPGTSTIDCNSLSNGTYTVLIRYEGADLPVGRFVLMK